MELVALQTWIPMRVEEEVNMDEAAAEESDVGDAVEAEAEEDALMSEDVVGITTIIITQIPLHLYMEILHTRNKIIPSWNL